ncbi:MAG: metallophosphoesterase [Clostridiales bacterium]|nr:metallophosphoesterase [Clostridiales bacterium]
MPRLFAIADLHLCASVENKSMDVFGARWERYMERLADNWSSVVREEDLVLIPGDISWAMRLEEAAADLAYIGALPGRKVLLRGNHDFWWASYAKVKTVLSANCFAIQNNVLRFGDLCIAGSRGWITPGMHGYTAEDEKIYLREQVRLRLSLDELPQDTQNVVMLHYPPFDNTQTPNTFAQIIGEYPVQNVVYGHLHGPAQKYAFSGAYAGARYDFVASDALGFVPREIGIF